MHYIIHAGVAHDENPPGRGSGRYPFGWRKDPAERKKIREERKEARIAKKRDRFVNKRDYKNLVKDYDKIMKKTAIKGTELDNIFRSQLSNLDLNKPLSEYSNNDLQAAMNVINMYSTIKYSQAYAEKYAKKMAIKYSKRISKRYSKKMAKRYSKKAAKKYAKQYAGD